MNTDENRREGRAALPRSPNQRALNEKMGRRSSTALPNKRNTHRLTQLDRIDKIHRTKPILTILCSPLRAADSKSNNGAHGVTRPTNPPLRQDTPHIRSVRLPFLSTWLIVHKPFPRLTTRLYVVIAGRLRML